MITTSDFKKGVRFEHEGAPWQIMDISVHNPSARGSATLVKVKVRNLISAQVLQKTFKSGEMFQEPDLAKVRVQYLYEEGTDLVFMDQETYEQYPLPKDRFSHVIGWLSDGFELDLLRYNSEMVNMELPQSVTIKVQMVEAGAKGDTASGKVLSKAVLENGVELMVPSFVKEGSSIHVDPNTNTYLGRT